MEKIILFPNLPPLHVLVLFEIEPQSQTTAKNYDQLDCNKLVEDLRGEDKRIYLVKEITALKESLKKEAMLGKVILFLSNGQFLGLWESDFSTSLNA